jgi:hypothetical protein
LGDSNALIVEFGKSNLCRHCLVKFWIVGVKMVALSLQKAGFSFRCLRHKLRVSLVSYWGWHLFVDNFIKDWPPILRCVSTHLPRWLRVLVALW